MKRDNDYYLDRLKRDGFDELLKRIRAGKISVYAASIEAGFRRRKSTETRANQVTYHWKRAGAADRERFVVDNFRSLRIIMLDLTKKLKASKEKVDSPSE